VCAVWWYVRGQVRGVVFFWESIRRSRREFHY
jgi:hypothetical protein